MAMTNSDKELIEEKFKSLHDLLNVKFTAIDANIKILISKQDKTNGRVNELEKQGVLNNEQHNTIGEILDRINNTYSNYTKRNIGFWLWFSEKPYRLITFIAILGAVAVGLGVV